MEAFTTIINGGSISANGVMTHDDEFDWASIVQSAYAAFHVVGVDTSEIYDYAIIQTAYMTIDYFLSHADFTSIGVILVFIGYIAFVVEFAYVVWIFNRDSEHLCNQFKQLKNTLNGIYIEDHEFVFGEGGQLQDARFARNLLVNEFQDFRGFDGLGYFTLGKPLLTSITANILTYLIVLIQFKISENSTQK